MNTMKTQYIFFLLIFMTKLAVCQTRSTESIQCAVDTNGMYYHWEVKITDKENTMIDRFKINKARLSGLIPQLRRTDFYKNLKVIAVLKNAESFVLLIDKFGEVDVHIYPLSANSQRKIIPFMKYKASPMDMDFVGEDFQDSKLVGDTVYTLSKDIRGNIGLYFISSIDLHTGIVQRAAVDISSLKQAKDSNHTHSFLVELEDRSFKTTGFGFKFSLLINGILVIQKNNIIYYDAVLDFKVSETVKNKVNSIIE